MFNKNNFKEILIKALGDRTKTQYADESGVNRTYISKYLNEKLDNPPTPDILKRLSQYAHNGVTYEDFMIAAGHISELNLNEDTNEYTIALHNTDGYDADLPPEAREELKEYIKYLKHKYKKD